MLMTWPRGSHAPQVIAGDPGDRFGFPVLVDEFCRDLAVRGYAEETIRVSRGHLARFVDWLRLEAVTHPADVSRVMIRHYQEYLHDYRKADGSRLPLTSQGAAIAPIQRLYEWAHATERLNTNPTVGIELPQREHRLPKAVLTLQEARRVLAQPDTSTELGMRDRAILETFLSTGIRRGELARLTVQDLDHARQTLWVRQAKGGKDRIVPIGPDAIEHIDRYLKRSRPRLRHRHRTNVLFLASDGYGLSPHRLSRIVTSYVEASGIGKQGSCHMFRHTLATLMIEAGTDIRYVQAMLGHTSLTSTQIYTHVSIPALQAAHRATFTPASPGKHTRPTA